MLYNENKTRLIRTAELQNPTSHLAKVKALAKNLDIMVDIHRIRARIKKLDRKENFSKLIPNTYLDVLQYLQEAAYFMAEF